MRLRVAVLVVVFLMLVATFAGLTRNGSATGTNSAATVSTVSASTPSNATQMSSSALVSGPAPATLTSPYGTGITSGQNTYVYSFDTSNEGFTKPVDYSYSNVYWSSANHNIYILSDRRDPGDERLVHTTPTLDATSDFTVTARWKATTQGNWQYAFPVFIMSSSNTQVLTSNSITFYYASRDSHLANAPWYYLFYYDASGTQHNLGTFVAQTNTEYHFFIHYDSSTKLLRMEIRSAADVTLIFGQYRIGSNPNDGFTLGQVGASAHGFSSTQEPYTVAWTDDIAVTYATGAYRDTVLDQGDGNVKIGWLASNFDNNAADGWTKDSGTVSWSGGVMTIQTNSVVHAGTSWYDQQFQFDVTFTTSGTLTAAFRYKDSNNYYKATIARSTGVVTFSKVVAGTSTSLGSFTTTITLNAAYTTKLVARGNTFEIWWAGTQRWSGSDPSPPSAISGYVRFATDSAAQVNIDNVRVWNTAQGSIDQSVSDAGANRPLSTSVAGTVDIYNQVHVYVRSSPDNVLWDPWTLLKADAAAGTSFGFPDQERQRYYQLRAVLTSGINGTPLFTSFSTTVGSPTTNPVANTGMLPWYPYVGGMVNAVNQNLVYTKQDIAFQGKGFTLAVVRAYNSQQYLVDSPWGPGWTFNYNENLTFNIGGSIIWTDGTGAQFTFLPKGSTGGYSPPRGVSARLVKNADQTFTLWRRDGSREQFSATGALATIADRNGNKLTLAYDGAGHLASVSDDAGKALRFTWNSTDQIFTQVTDPLGRTVNYSAANRRGNELGDVVDPMGYDESYTYYGYGLRGSCPCVLSGITDPVGKSTSFTYVNNTQVSQVSLAYTVGLATQWQFREYSISAPSATTRTVTNARGYQTNLTLNSFGAAVTISGPAFCVPGTQPGCMAFADQKGNSTSYAWDGELNKVRVVDARGDATASAFGVRDNVVSSTDAGGNESVDAWTEVNTADAFFTELTSATGHRGFTTSSAYDSRGNQVRSVDPGGNVTTMAYDALGFLNKTVSPRGYTSWFVYNASGWLVRQVDPMNDATLYGYDVLGRLTTVTSPMGFVTTTIYDADSRVNQTRDPLQHTTTNAYNARGDLVEVTDADLFATRYAVNVTSGAMMTVTDPSGNQTASYTYDPTGNLVSRTDGNGHTTRFGYDYFNRLTSMTTPLNEVTSYAYDSAGNRIRRTDGNGASTRYSYDRLNRLYRINYPGSPVYATPQTLTFLYDQDGNLASATGFGYTETRTYDGSARIASTSFNYGTFIATTSFVYDADGNRATLKDSSGGTTTYSYDSADRMKTIADPEGYATSFFTDRDSRANLTVEIGGVRQVDVYDASGRLVTVYTNGSGGTIQKIAYAYDSAGLRTSETDTVGVTITTTNYTYDRAHRLYRTSQGSTTTVDTYDAVGNLVQEVAGVTTTYAYNADNEMTYANQTPGSSYLNSYDFNGNRVFWSNGAHGGDVYYSYDFENRLVESRRGIVPYTNDTYSPTGERVSSSQLQPSVVTTYYGYDYAAHNGPTVIADYASSSARLDRYTKSDGPAASPVELYTSGAHYAYEADALGSTRRITDGVGNTIDTYAYDSWGGTTQTGSLAQPFQYAGMPIDSTDALYYAQARFYDPGETGGHRFLSRDPLGDGYAYADDSPLNFVDPTGEATFKTWKSCATFLWWSDCYQWWIIVLSESEFRQIYSVLSLGGAFATIAGGIIYGWAHASAVAAGTLAAFAALAGLGEAILAILGGWALGLAWIDYIDAMGGYRGVYLFGEMHNGIPMYSVFWHV